MELENVVSLLNLRKYFEELYKAGSMKDQDAKRMEE